MWALDAAGNSSVSNPTLRLTMPPGDDQPPGAPGGTVSLGLVASGTQLPEEVTLNGGLCVVADE
ncbi:hypothetical protein ACLQ3B_12890 [Micromonospora sp. DT53]|uniref:hypothetical protein n=1 Tax=Micromonospora sp. DT53 TaxID=3393444 RepID=UPI003CF207E8